MFDALSDQLESAWKKLRGQDKITESNIKEALREVRRALLGGGCQPPGGETVC